MEADWDHLKFVVLGLFCRISLPIGVIIVKLWTALTTQLLRLTLSLTHLESCCNYYFCLYVYKRMFVLYMYECDFVYFLCSSIYHDNNNIKHTIIKTTAIASSWFHVKQNVLWFVTQNDYTNKYHLGIMVAAVFSWCF